MAVLTTTSTPLSRRSSRKRRWCSHPKETQCPTISWFWLLAQMLSSHATRQATMRRVSSSTAQLKICRSSLSSHPRLKGTTGVVVGGGLLGLEAAKAMMDLEEFKSVKLIERNRWVLSRQLDGDAGGMVVELVRNLGLDVMLSKRVGKIWSMRIMQSKAWCSKTESRWIAHASCSPSASRLRDELARKAGIKCADRGGGITIDNDLRTSDPNIYAIGECASWENQTFGLIAPGVEQADVLSFNLTQAKAHSPRTFKRPDLSTKLKLLGVEVASFGDFFADRDGPKDLPVTQAWKWSKERMAPSMAKKRSRPSPMDLHRLRSKPSPTKIHSKPSTRSTSSPSMASTSLVA